MHFEDTIKIIKCLNQSRSEFKSLNANYDDIMSLTSDVIETTYFSWQTDSLERHRLKELLDCHERKLKKLESAHETAVEDYRRVKAELISAEEIINQLTQENLEYKRRFGEVYSLIRTDLTKSIIPAYMRPENSFRNSFINCGRTNVDVTLMNISSDRNDLNIHYLGESGSSPENFYNSTSNPDDIFPESHRRSFRVNARQRSTSQPPIMAANASGERGKFEALSKTTPSDSVFRERSGVKRSISESQGDNRADRNEWDTARSAKIAREISHHTPLVSFGSGWTRGRRIVECVHTFIAGSCNLFTPFTTYCIVCTKALKLNILKCRDCKIQIHERCRSQAPIPCVPIISTPHQRNPKHRPKLVDFCPDSCPKIPAN